MKYLFDRICTSDDESIDSRGPIESTLAKLVTREISRITNQRQYFQGFGQRAEPAQKDPSVLNFGITRGIGETLSHERCKKMAFEIKRAILAHEPRLRRPTVSFKTGKSFVGITAFEVSGYLEIDQELVDYYGLFSARGAG